MDAHERFEGFLAAVPAASRPKVNQFLVNHSMVSEEALVDAGILFAEIHLDQDAELNHDRVFGGYPPSSIELE